MSDEEAESLRLRLISSLAEAEQILRDHSIGNWPGLLHEARQRLEHRDLAGITKLLRLYGGMGSLNDVMIPAGVRHSHDHGTAVDAEKKWDTLRRDMHDLATRLQRYGRLSLGL